MTMIDFSFMLPIEILAALVAVVVGARYLRHLDKPRQRSVPSYRHTNYYIDKAVIVNADPSRPTFRLGRGVPLPGTNVQALSRGEQLMLLDASRPLKSASEAEKRAFARRLDMIMRGYA